jgi:hypothetical protein
LNIRFTRSELGSQCPAVQLAGNLDRSLNHPHFVGRLTILSIVTHSKLGVRDNYFCNGGIVRSGGKSAAILHPLGHLATIRLTAGGGAMRAEIDVSSVDSDDGLTRTLV